MWNREQYEQDFRQPDQETPPGVIDTIGLGYSRLLEYPGAIIIPVLLDLYLWLGFKVTAEPLTLRAAGHIRGMNGVGDWIAGFMENRSQLNVFELASLRLPTVRLPTILPLVSDDQTLSLASISPELMGTPWWAILLIAVAALAGSFLIGAEYLCRLSAATVGTPHRFSIRRLLGLARTFLAWLLLLAGAFVLITAPLIVAEIAFNLAGVGTAGVITFLMVVPAIWGFVAFFFSVYAIVVDRMGALESLRASYRVVRRYLWQSIGFIAAYFLVVNAFPLVWQRLLAAPLGIALAIVGHAFVASGMIAAAMIFYHDRVRRIDVPDLATER